MDARVSGQTRQLCGAECPKPSHIFDITLLDSVSQSGMLTPKYGIPVAGGADDSDQSTVAAISRRDRCPTGLMEQDENGLKKRSELRPNGASHDCETRPASQAGKDFPERMSADDQFTEYGERRQ